MNSDDLKDLLNDVFVVGKLLTDVAHNETPKDFHFDTKTIVIIAVSLTALVVLKQHLKSVKINITQ